MVRTIFLNNFIQLYFLSNLLFFVSATFSCYFCTCLLCFWWFSCYSIAKLCEALSFRIQFKCNFDQLQVSLFCMWIGLFCIIFCHVEDLNVFRSLKFRLQVQGIIRIVIVCFVPFPAVDWNPWAADRFGPETVQFWSEHENVLESIQDQSGSVPEHSWGFSCVALNIFGFIFVGLISFVIFFAHFWCNFEDIKLSDR